MTGRSRAIRDGVVFVAIGAILAGCTEPEFRNFFPSGTPFERSFAQLFDDGGTPKLSHYAILTLLPAEVRTPATGTIEYVRAFDAMGNCLLLRPKKYFSTDNDTSRLQALPKPGALVVALCNLTESTVQSAAEARYTEVLSAGEAPGAAAQFINNDEEFRTLDVEVHESDIMQSTLLGSADAGRLFLASYVEEEDGAARVYINPLPYLAGAVSPASDLDAVAPSITSVVLETSASGNFDDSIFHTPTGGPGIEQITGSVPANRMRAVIRSSEQSWPAATEIVPYGFVYQLDRITLSGNTVTGRETKSEGRALLNAFPMSQAVALAGGLYGDTAPTASDPSTGTYFVHLMWHGRRPPLDNDTRPYNGLQAPASLALDLAETVSGEARFPTGDYELQITAFDTVNPLPTAPHKTIRFNISGAAAPGDGTLTYNPTNGPIGTRVTINSIARPDAFLAANTTVEFTGTFDPDGQDAADVDLPPTPTMTVSYPADKVSVTDGANLVIRVGAVLPDVSVMDAANMRYGRGGVAAGTLRVRTPGATPPFDHSVANVTFRISENVRFGRVVDGAFQAVAALPITSPANAADVAGTPDFQRVDVEWRVAVEPGVTSPSAINADVKTLNASGVPLDAQNLSIALVGEENGLAIYRSGNAGSPQLVFIDSAALTGPHGTALVAVQMEAGGVVRLDGTPPP